MNTRRGRKQMLTAVLTDDQQEKTAEVSEKTTIITSSTAAAQAAPAANSGSSNTNKNNILRAFLETWLSTKRELAKGKSSDEMHDEISKRLIEKGYAVSSKLVKHKIASFVKKYQYVQKCEREGKKIEWCNYDIVKQIFDLDGLISGGSIVSIPRQNIKSEDELDIDEEFLSDNKNGNDNEVVVTAAATASTAQTQTLQQTNIKEERVELIEIPDEDTYTRKNE